ncbi:MAG: ankyrin repeat domain-containing protein [Gammaproteobacteria bacterium]
MQNRQFDIRRLNLEKIDALLAKIKSANIERLIINDLSTHEMNKAAERSLARLFMTRNLAYLAIRNPKMAIRPASIFLKALSNNVNLLSCTIDFIEPKQQEKLQELIKRNIYLLKAVALITYEFLETQLTGEYREDIQEKINDLKANILSIDDYETTIFKLAKALTELEKKFENPEIIRLFQQNKSAIKMIIDYTLEGYTPQFFAAYWGCKDFLVKLNELNLPMQVSLHNGTTPLHLAAHFGFLSITELLVDEFKCNPDAKNINDKTPADLAYAAKHTLILEYLKSKSDKKVDDKEMARDERLNLAGRRLYAVLGGKKISQLVPTQGTTVHGSGGEDLEGYETLAHFLKQYESKYSDEKDRDVRKKIQKIYANLTAAKTLTPKPPAEVKTIAELMQHLESQKQDIISEIYHKLSGAAVGDRQLLLSGFITHLVGISIEKKAHTYVMSIADRGYFYRMINPKQPAKGVSLLTLEFDAQHLQAVLEQLFAANITSKDVAEKMLFETIPKMVNATYQKNTQILQSKFKEALCYFGNPKTLLYEEFVKEFGFDKGKKMYKDFTLFMRERAVAEFTELAGLENKFSEAGGQIVREKKLARERLFSASSVDSESSSIFLDTDQGPKNKV